MGKGKKKGAPQARRAPPAAVADGAVAEASTAAEEAVSAAEELDGDEELDEGGEGDGDGAAQTSAAQVAEVASHAGASIAEEVLSLYPDRLAVEARELLNLPPPRKAWRTVAFARRAVTVYLNDALTKVLGGEFLADRDAVESVRREPAFRLIEVESSEHLAKLQAEHGLEVANVRARAAELGYVLLRDGEQAAPKKRG